MSKNKKLNSKLRIDKLVCSRGLVESRQRAQALIMAGKVFVDGRRVDKAGTEVDAEAGVEVTGFLPYVSRGGLKPGRVGTTHRSLIAMN